MLLIIALLAGDAALCMFVVNNFGVVSGLGVVVTINLGFAWYIHLLHVKVSKTRERFTKHGIRSELGETTDHILHGNNAVVNNALKAAETAHKVENMKLAGGGRPPPPTTKVINLNHPRLGRRKIRLRIASEVLASTFDWGRRRSRKI